jgi:hypothetical protein
MWEQDLTPNPPENTISSTFQVTQGLEMEPVQNPLNGVNDSKLSYTEFCAGFAKSVKNRNEGSDKFVNILLPSGDVKLTGKLNIHDFPGPGAPRK